MVATTLQPERNTEHREVDPEPGRSVLYRMQASARHHRFLLDGLADGAPG